MTRTILLSVRPEHAIKILSGDGCGCCESETISGKFVEVIGNIHENED